MRHITKLEIELKVAKAKIAALTEGIEYVRGYASSNKFMGTEIEDRMINKDDIILRCNEVLSNANEVENGLYQALVEVEKKY